jgi:hypothetical protein
LAKKSIEPDLIGIEARRRPKYLDVGHIDAHQDRMRGGRFGLMRKKKFS